MSGEAIRRLAAALGVQLLWTDWRGRDHEVSTDSLAAVLAAMGHDPGDPASLSGEAERLDQEGWRRVLPPFAVVRTDGGMRVPFTVLRPLLPAIRVTVVSADGEGAGAGSWTVDPGSLEAAGERRLGDLSFTRRLLPLPPLDPGIYRLALATAEGRPLDETRLLVAPGRCREPEGRTWGLSIQLYALRSERNWGIGDFTDLARLAAPAAALGADFIGVSPLHALFPAEPERCSPYSPCHREFLNVLFLDPEAVPEHAASVEARGRVARNSFQARLAALRAAEQVDYAGVAAAKDEALRLAWERFRRAPAPGRREAWQAFLEEGGERLRDFATWCALHRHFARAGRAGGFRAWPEAYRRSDAPGSRAFARAQRAEVDYHCWLQWQAREQLDAARETMHAAGMRTGLFEDLAVGADPGGAEAWCEPGLYVTGAAVGAPPDPLAARGQDWGLPPVSPAPLREGHVEPLRRLLATLMSRAGALRLDHAMGLGRLWWVPADRPPTAGAYVSYPREALLGLVALESLRAGCVVVGEDLGTVPDSLRGELGERGVLTCRVLLFQRDEGGAFLSPERYPAGALVTPATHDMPTLPGWWAGRDIELDRALDGDDESGKRRLEERARERGRLLEALTQAGLLPEPGPEPPPAEAVVAAAHCFLAATPAAMLALRPEDWMGVEWPANVPGTVSEYPNWRRKLPEGLTGFLSRPRIRALAAALGAARAAGPGGTEGLTG